MIKEPQESSIREAWILCFVLGLVMINFPFIHIFDTNQPIFGIPEMVLYFFVGWPLSIAVIAIFVYFSKLQQQPPDEREENSEP